MEFSRLESPRHPTHTPLLLGCREFVCSQIEIALHCFVISTVCSNTIRRSFCQTKFYGNVFCAPFFDKQHKMRAHFYYRQEKIFGIRTCLAVAIAVDVVDFIPFVLFLFVLFFSLSFRS